jgi:Flp pilus assembly protein TadD
MSSSPAADPAANCARSAALRRFGAAALIVAAAAMCYVPALRGGFVFDDHALVEGNRLLRGPLWRLWFSDAATDYWPLTWTLLWAQWRAWGPSALGYHAVDLGLHAATALLLWRVLRTLDIPGAWLAGLFFAVHPVAVESAAWISETKNTLSAALLLLTVLAWLRYEEEGRLRLELMALGLFGLALLAKAAVVTLPAVLLGISTWRRGGIRRRQLVDIVPFLAVALAVGLVNVWFQRQNAMAGGWAPARGFLERLGGAGWALGAYLRAAFLPVGLSFVRAPWPAALPSALFFAPLAALAGFAALLAWAWRRWSWGRAASMALAYHAVLLLPVLGFVDIAYFHVSPVSNHLQYHALMGPVTLIAAGLSLAARRLGRSGPLVPAAVVALLGAITFARAGAFADDRTLWTSAVRETPASATAHATLGAILLDEGRRPEAVAELGAAADAAVDPADRERYRALLGLYSGDSAGAVTHALEVIRLGRDPDVRRDAAFVLLEEGRSADAIAVLRPLVREAPASADYAYWLGAALARQGRAGDALELLRGWCAARPGNPQLEETLAMLLVRAGRIEEARERAAAALGIDPADAAAEAQLRAWRTRSGL